MGRLICLALLDVLLALLAWFLWSAGWQWIDAQASRNAAHALGRGALTVRLAGSSWCDLVRGNIGSLDMRATQFKLRQGPRLDDLHIHASGLQVSHQALQALGSATFEARLKQDDLNAFLRQKGAGHLPIDITVALHPGRVEVEVKPRGLLGLGLQKLHASFGGHFEVHNDGNDVYYVVDDSSFGGSEREVVQAVLDWLHQDLSTQPTHPRLTRFEVGEGEVSLAGTATPPLPMPFAPPPANGAPEADDSPAP